MGRTRTDGNQLPACIKVALRGCRKPGVPLTGCTNGKHLGGINGHRSMGPGVINPSVLRELAEAF